MEVRPILTVNCGQPPEAIGKVHGSYMDWFRAGLGPRAELVEWNIRESLDQPHLGNFAGVLITGSPASLTAPEPWMEVAVETIREAAESALPLLGVCFGHQLVGCAYGAPTVPAPEPGEHGSLLLELSELGSSDPLFRGCPRQFEAQFSHYDQVDPMAVAYSNGLRILASTDNTRVQALAAGEHVRSVQFHPEFSSAIMTSYLRAGGDSSEARECQHASSIFSNWLENWVL